MGVTLYLLRHGETDCSRQDLYCGSLDPELTPEGVEMAEAFAAAYRGTPWEAVYASPMRRTVATARPVCAATGLTAQLRDGLKEINYGQWEGRSRAEVRRRFPEEHERWLVEPSWNAPTGGETGAQVASRASVVIEEITSNHKQGNVLVVSHKATLRLILCMLLGIDMGRYRDRLDAPAASVSVVRFGEHGPMLTRLGDRSHFPAELLSRPGS